MTKTDIQKILGCVAFLPCELRQTVYLSLTTLEQKVPPLAANPLEHFMGHSVTEIDPTRTKRTSCRSEPIRVLYFGPVVETWYVLPKCMHGNGITTRRIVSCYIPLPVLYVEFNKEIYLQMEVCYSRSCCKHSRPEKIEKR